MRNQCMNDIDRNLYEKLILPRDAIGFLKAMGNVLEINLYLAQNRFYFKRDMTGSSRKKEKEYGSLLGERVRRNGINETDCNEINQMGLLGLLNKRNKEIAGNFLFWEKYTFEPYDKLLLGEGSGAYIDAQPLRLHPLYGIPYLPSSVLKGTLRSVWVSEKYEGKEEKAEADDDFILLFGGKRSDSKQVEGKLVFLDIFPETFEIGLDVQTIHFDEYYKPKHIEPTDDQDTKPVSFICLRRAVFSIIIACDDQEVWGTWKAEIDDMVDCMMTQYGIGAKTALGYGVGV